MEKRPLQMRDNEKIEGTDWEGDDLGILYLDNSLKILLVPCFIKKDFRLC